MEEIEYMYIQISPDQLLFLQFRLCGSRVSQWTSWSPKSFMPHRVRQTFKGMVSLIGTYSSFNDKDWKLNVYSWVVMWKVLWIPTKTTALGRQSIFVQNSSKNKIEYHIENLNTDRLMTPKNLYPVWTLVKVVILVRQEKTISSSRFFFPYHLYLEYESN